MNRLFFVCAPHLIPLLYASEVFADRGVFYRAFVRLNTFVFVPGASIDFPLCFRAWKKIDVHVRAVKYVYFFRHLTTSGLLLFNLTYLKAKMFPSNGGIVSSLSCEPS